MSAFLTFGVASPARADTEIDGYAGQFDWAGAKSFPFCYDVNPDIFFVECAPATIGEVNFNVRVTLHGKYATVRTDWHVTSGDHAVQVFSFVECRRDEWNDDSCGFAGVGGYQDFSSYGSITDVFELPDSGKYFFNLHYGVSVEGAGTSPGTDLIDAMLGTSHRIKCSAHKTWICEMA